MSGSQESEQLYEIKRLSRDLIYVTGALHTSSVHSNASPHVIYLKIWQMIGVNILISQSGVYLSIILVWRTISFEMIRFRAVVSICRGGGGDVALQCVNEADPSLHLSRITYVHLISPPTLTTSLPAWFNQISLRNQCRTSCRTCKTCFPTNLGCVINHVEIKVKGEGLTLSSES